ncbi:murein L,D-transpeptidase [Pseudomonas saudiphocaensis]|nr:L,D-transpeptidase family protein [Pseudomonas saudiphocaensis]RRV17268.1 murein L,D-transpeptidase [Pseudomonas saudiphocaensis]
MYKKHAFRLLVPLLLTPLLACADGSEAPGPMLGALQMLPEACGKPLADIDSQARQQLTALYARAQFEPLWTSYAQLDELLSQLNALADDGLSPATYHTETIHRTAHTATAKPLHRECSDLLASHGYLLALQHLTHGRLPQALHEPVWRRTEAPATQRDEQLLDTAAQALKTPRLAFDKARPALEQYRNLRLAYAQLRRAERTEQPNIPSGKTLRSGMTDPRLPLLRQRLSADDYLPAAAVSPDGADTYNAADEAALLAFQRHHGLQDDGVLGVETLAALNATADERLGQLRANLERFRWLSGDIEDESLLVDIAGGRVIHIHHGQPLWETRAQVGRNTRQTPAIKSSVTRLTLNPTWTIPPTILREDKLPKIRESLDYLAQQNLQVLDYQGNLLDPQLIDWNNPGNILLRQAAGPDNPLGRVAIRFANPYSIYLHDTPSQGLFGRAQRATSSGCVRVESVMQLVNLLLAENEQERFERLLETGKTYEFRLSKAMPILLAYWTAEADSSGQPRYRPDIYQRDRSLLGALSAADQQPLEHSR